jgi:pimeloyl-ACP methyl ester carboxylesterase
MSDAPNTIVLIHGLWMTPLAWEHWAARYEERGFTVLTPGYPGIEAGEAGVAALREDASAIAGVGVREVLDHLTEVIEKLDTPPIIMGHSFGGTFAQLLVGAGLGAAGVSIDGAAVKGVNAMPLSELRSVLPVLKDPANIHRAVPLMAKQFHYAFTNTLDENASQQAYDRYAVPTPARILFQGGFAAVTPHAATTFDFSDNAGRRCCLSPAAATTSCPLPSSGRTTRRTPSTRRRSPPTPSSKAAITSPAASPAGKPSPTTPWTGH